MPRYLAFLRGINLGRRRVKMDHLRDLFAELGFRGVETFIASGNVIFEERACDPRRLAGRISAHLEARLGYGVDTFVRSPGEISALAAARPFAAGDMTDENTIHVGFLAAPLPPAQARGLIACNRASDEFRLSGDNFFWLYRGRKSSDSDIWAAPAVRALRLPSFTLRNRTTIRKLAELHPA